MPGSNGRDASLAAADADTAAANVAEAGPKVIRDLKSGKLDIGLEERTLEGGFDAIKFEYVDDLPDRVAEASYDRWEGLNGEVFGNVTIRVDRQGAVTLGETYRSIGHELGHLVPRVRALSPIAPEGMSPAFSPRERAAERIGVRVGRHFGY